MARVINTENPGKRRHALRRTIAEILRHLMFKREVDDEVKDMAATLVFCLREMGATVEETVEAWEKRDYYVKADRFRLEWEWLTPAAERLADLVRQGRWERLPVELARLAPRFSDIRIAKATRSSAIWQGRYRALIQEGA